MEYISRSQWGARAPKAVNALIKSEGIFIHHSVTPEAPAVNIVRQIQNMHMDQRGWLDIAYSWLVDRDGNIYEGRGWGVAGGHTEGYNSRSHAVCYIGNTDNGLPPVAALNAINVVVAEHQSRYGGFVKSHRDVNATACPGSHLHNWVHTGRPVGGTSVPTPPVASPPVPPVVPPKPAAPKLPRPAPTLRQGSRGAEVKKLQAALKLFDGSIGLDGIFGPHTKAVLTNFQRFWKIDADGIYGPQTSKALDAVLKLRGV
jgi:hypothetical protein